MTNTLINRAKLYAKVAHGEIDQRRKYTNEPYIVHPAAVAKLVQSVEHTPAMVAAAWLHDTVEDTNATLEEIQELFGITVAQYVEMLTDVATPADGNRAARCRINNIHTGKAFDRVKTIKLADCIDNCISIARQDPKFAITYFKEKRDLLPYLVGGDKKLYKILKDILK